MIRIILDIETGPLAREALDAVKPHFRASRAKKPDKVAEEIAEKEAKFYDDAALDPTTGKVLAIGVHTLDYALADKPKVFTKIFASGDEKADLQGWWSLWGGKKRSGGESGLEFPFQLGATLKIVGFNLLDFDLPFLINRSWIMGVQIPGSFIDVTWLERHEHIIDMMLIWNCKRYKRSYKSLNAVAVSLGVGSKKAENSELFFKLWEENREEAIAHLANDLAATAAVYNRITQFTYGHNL